MGGLLFIVQPQTSLLGTTIVLNMIHQLIKNLAACEHNIMPVGQFRQTGLIQTGFNMEVAFKAGSIVVLTFALFSRFSGFKIIEFFPWAW